MKSTRPLTLAALPRNSVVVGPYHKQQKDPRKIYDETHLFGKIMTRSREIFSGSGHGCNENGAKHSLIKMAREVGIVTDGYLEIKLYQQVKVGVDEYVPVPRKEAMKTTTVFLWNLLDTQRMEKAKETFGYCVQFDEEKTKVNENDEDEGCDFRVMIDDLDNERCGRNGANENHNNDN